jgi:Flp pilus assembly protein TadG
MQHHRRRQRGSTIVILAAVITVLLGFAALSVDMGMLYSARTSAQRAADAAAMAGAFAFVTRPDLTTLNATDPTGAQNGIKQYAVSAAAVNKVTGQPVVINNGDVTVDFSTRRVTVQVANTQNTLFARVLGENSATVRVTAVAEASFNATGDRCTKPWFIPNTVLASAENKKGQKDDICDTLDSGGNVTQQGACSKKELLIDPATGDITPFAQNWINTSCPSRQLVIKPQNPQAQAVLGPGTFLAIQLGGTGAAVYEDNIPNCPPVVVSCTETYSSEQGNMVGPTQQGVCRLICYSGSQQCNNCQKDAYVSPGHYRRPDNTISSTSRSLVVAPIIDVCTFCPAGVPNGSSALSNLQMIGYALMFVEDFGNLGNCGGGGGGGGGGGQPGVLARLIDIIPCSAGAGGGGAIDPDNTGPFATPVRLIRNP